MQPEILNRTGRPAPTTFYPSAVYLQYIDTLCPLQSHPERLIARTRELTHAATQLLWGANATRLLRLLQDVGSLIVTKHLIPTSCTLGAAHSVFPLREPVDAGQGIVLKGVGNPRAKPHFVLHLIH